METRVIVMFFCDPYNRARDPGYGCSGSCLQASLFSGMWYWCFVSRSGNVLEERQVFFSMRLKQFLWLSLEKHFHDVGGRLLISSFSLFLSQEIKCCLVKASVSFLTADVLFEIYKNSLSLAVCGLGVTVKATLPGTENLEKESSPSCGAPSVPHRWRGGFCVLGHLGHTWSPLQCAVWSVGAVLDPAISGMRMKPGRADSHPALGLGLELSFVCRV